MMNFLEKLKPLALLLLRLALAIVFVFHGYPKLFGETQRFVRAFADLGLPAYTVYIAGILELFGGCLLVLGLFTRPVGMLLTLHMAAAMYKFNLREGFYAVREYELPLTLAAAAFALAAVGAGTLSADHLIYGTRSRSKPKTPKDQ